MSPDPEQSGSSSSAGPPPPGGFPSPSQNGPESGVISAPHSISQAVKARKAEYTRRKTIRIKVGSWNVASLSGTEKDLGGWFVEGKGVKGLSDNFDEPALEYGATDTADDHIESIEDQELRRSKRKATVPENDVPAVPGGDEIDLYVLGLQEVVDVSSVTEALRPMADPSTLKKWKTAMETALPEGYEKIASMQLLGLLILVYASPDIAPTIGSVSTASVGTGLMGYMGNKGAVSVRIVLGETTRFVFVNSHLAAGSDKTALERRNWDTAQITNRTRFDPITDGVEVTEEFGDAIGDEDFAFWFGDLNYRVDDIPGDDVRRLLLLHTRNEYDLNNKSKRKIDSELGYVDVPSDTISFDDYSSNAELDPTSLQVTLQSLLPHDQLHAQQKLRKAFHDGWREGPIKFLPTYKYDVGSVGMFDSGEKKRGPSWCDRILYRTRRDRLEYAERLKQEEVARKKDDEMKGRGLDDPSDEDVLFDYDPDADGLAYGDDYYEDEDAAHDAQLVETREGYEDTISLDHYISHQRILSSDHKPLDAVFTLTYEAVIPSLKAKVHQEVVRQLDRAENEGRPAVTLVVDNNPYEPIANADDSAEQADHTGVHFGDIRFGALKSRGLTIANTGRVPATFCFIDRPVSEGRESGIAPPWLDLYVDRPSDNANSNPSALRNYTLAPGDTSSVIITVKICDFDVVHDLNSGSSRIDDVLVLRIKDGPDHFIPIRGTWMLSCFGRTLDDLVMLPEGGVRKLQENSQSQPAGRSLATTIPTSQSQGGRLSAPRELFALTEAVQDSVERSLAEWEMTNAGIDPPWHAEVVGFGWPFESQSWTLKESPERSVLLEAAREALDTMSPITTYFGPEITTLVRAEILAETLLTFLQSLRDGIIPAELWIQIETQLQAKEKAKARQTSEELQTCILEIISSASVHSIAFTFLTFMLMRVANEVAPLPHQLASRSQPSRVSTSSTRSGTSDMESPVSPSDQAATKASVFSPFRRRNRVGTFTSSAGDSTDPSPALARRLAVDHAFASIFAEAMVRTGSGPPHKEKEKKTLEDRKRAVIESFLVAPS